MEKVEILSEIKHYIECPYCGESKKQIDHLLSIDEERSFGYWYCDSCGGGFKGTVKGRDVFVEKVENRKDDSLVFLKNGNVLLVVKGMYFDGELKQENDEFYYGEHTCPTNYIPNVEMIINLDNGDEDPHGIFEFIASIPYVDLDDVEDVLSLIPSKE